MLNIKKSRGFFEELHTVLLSEITTEDKFLFSLLSNDFERVEFIYNNPKLNKYEIKLSVPNKCILEAKALKDKGNVAFQKECYRKSLELYTQSLLKMPLDEDSVELSIIRANRSAALYRLKEYNSSLIDIEAALRLNYPKELTYKLKDRKARCLLALKQNKAAITALRETLTALDDSKLPLDRRQKWQNDIQIMTSVMLRKKKNNDEKTSLGDKNILLGNRNKTLKAINDAIEIKYDVNQGRFAAAKRNIEPGDVILIENAHCAVLLDEKRLTNCFHCFKKLTSSEPCPTCDRISFCSENCKNIALKSHHSVECSILEALWNSGISITCLMALRIITQRKAEYFFQQRIVLMKDEVKDTEVWSNRGYRSDDYLAVNHLVKHEKERKAEGFLHKSLVACFLLNCLKEAGYFKEIPDVDLIDCKVLIGGLLLRNLQILQFNAHEISELKVEGKDLYKCKSMFIGAGLYPTLAFFNHSCDPSLVRFFDGTKVFVTALKPIKSGEMIPENYGPIFTQSSKEERQKALKDHYWFECSCKACIENWPTIDKMDTNLLRFQCQNKSCGEVIRIPYDTTDFMAQCDKCNKFINILPGLKALQDSGSLFLQTQDLMAKGEVNECLKKFHQLFSIFDGTLLPPFKDYYLCQQGLKICYLAAGNKYSIQDGFHILE